MNVKKAGTPKVLVALLKSIESWVKHDTIRSCILNKFMRRRKQRLTSFSLHSE